MGIGLKRLQSLAPVFLSASALIVFYVLNRDFLSAAKPADVRWLKNLEAPLIGNVSLLSYLSWFFMQFSLSPMNSLTLSTALIFLSLPLAAFYLVRNITGDIKASFFAGVIALSFPSHIWVMYNSHYQSLLGIVFESLIVILILGGLKSIKRAVIIPIIGFLIALTDLMSGLVISATCVLHSLSQFILERKIRREHLHPLLSLTSLASFMFAEIQTFEPSASTLPLMIGIPLGIAGLFLLRHQRSFSLLLSWLFSSVSVPLVAHSPMALLYTSIPIAVSSSTLLPTCLREALHVGKELDEYHVELDAGKVAGILLCALLLFSAIIQSSVIVNNVRASTGIYFERYGSRELVEALDWIRTYSSGKTVILAEYPLGTWISSYTGRPVITNAPTARPHSNVGYFLQCYDAETILNANYEIRNRFLRLRDWEPVAPQRSPIVASSDGERYTDFLYLDENHATVTYEYGGAVVAPDFYRYVEKNTSWAVRSGEQASLKHFYLLEGGVTIFKGVGLDRSASALITYNITSEKAVLKMFTVKLWIPWERKLGFTEVSGNRFRLELDSGAYEVEFHGDLAGLRFGFDEKWSQPRIYAVFKPAENRVYAEILIKALDARPISWMDDGVVSESARELVIKRNVGYAVIPKAVKGDFMDKFGLDIGLFKSQFENAKLTVYKATP